MEISIKTRIAACALGATLVACDMGGGSGGKAGTLDVTGTILSAATMQPVTVGSVAVRDSTSGKVVYAQPSGLYRLPAASTAVEGAQRVVLRLEAPGFAPQILSIPTKPKLREIRFDARLFPLTSVAVSPSAQTTINVPATGSSPSFQVTFGATGQSGLRARYAVLTPADGPGVLRAAGARADQALQSGGMLYFDIVDASGATIPPPADLRMSTGPVGTGVMASIPDAGATSGWVMNPNGVWAEPQPAGSPTTGLSFRPTSFGMWNADRLYTTSCVIGKLEVTGDVAACKGGKVKALGPAGTASFDASDNAGSFCVTGAQLASANLVVGSISVAAPSMPGTAGSCANPASCAVLATPIKVDASACGKGDCTGGCPPGAECMNGTCVSGSSCALRCCPGRNDSCTPPAAACFCDDYCVEAGDCCADFGPACK